MQASKYRKHCRIIIVIDLIGYVILLLPGLLWLDIGLYDYAREAYEYGEVTGESAWNPVVWPFRSAWVLGFVVFTLQVVAEVLKALVVLMSGEPWQQPQGDGAGS